jgi:hypothetical protein
LLQASLPASQLTESAAGGSPVEIPQSHFILTMHFLKSKTELWDTDEIFHSIERRITLKGWGNINSYHALEFNLSDLGKNLNFGSYSHLGLFPVFDI